MSTEENMALVRSVFEEAVNSGSLAATDGLYAPTFVDCVAWSRQSPGPTDFREAVDDLRAAFPDLHMTIEHVAAGGDLVATCETWWGTHASTGEQATATVVHVFRIGDGKIVEEWSDGWGSLERLIAVPTPGPADG